MDKKGKSGKRNNYFLLLVILHLSLSYAGSYQFHNLGFIHFLWVGGLIYLLYMIRIPLQRTYHAPERIRKLTFSALMVILFLTTALRLYKIQTIPPGLWVDEIYTASNTLELKITYLTRDVGFPWENPFHMTPLVGEGWVETSNLYLYYFRSFWTLFGMSYVGIKMASVVPGIFAVWLLYLLVKRLWGIRAGLAAAFFLSVSSWQITLSRWGWDEVLLTALQIPVFVFLWRGIRTRRIFDFALSGVFMGLCLYTYIASRIIVFFVFFYLFLEILITPGFFKKHKLGLGYFLIFLIMVFLPLGIYYFNHPTAFLARMKDVSIFTDIGTSGSLSPLFHNIIRHVFMFHYYSDPNIRHHVSRPLLDIVSGIFMLVGFIFALKGIKERKNRFALLWLLFGLLGGILSASREAPQAYRTGISAPAVFALCGLGFAGSLRILKRMAGRKRLRLANPLAGLVLLLCLGINFHRYFILYPQSPGLWKDFWGADRSFMAQALQKERLKGTGIVLDGSFRSNFYFVFRAAMRIICGQAPVEYFDPVHRTPVPPPQGFTVYLPPFRKRIYDYLLPSAAMKPIMNPTGEIVFYRAHIDSGILAKSPDVAEEKKRPFEILYYKDEELLTKIYKEMLEPNPVPENTNRIVIHTCFLLPNDYHTVYLLKSNYPTEVLLDGNKMPFDEKGQAFIPLSGAPHPMRIEIREVKSSPLEFQFLWRPDFEHTEPIPPEFFLPKDPGANTDLKTP